MIWLCIRPTINDQCIYSIVEQCLQYIRNWYHPKWYNLNNWIDISTGKLWLGFPSWCRMWSLTKLTFPLSSPTQSGEELALPNSCCIISFRYQYLSFNIPNTFIAFLGQSHKHLTSKDAFNINVNPQIYITAKNAVVSCTFKTQSL